MEKFDLETFLPFRLNRASEAISLRFANEYRVRYQMTRPEWRTLALLGQLGKVTATEIGRQSGMHKTKVSRAVFALEERRWLKRIRDEHDRRVEHLELTAQGRKGFDEIAALANAYARELERLLGSKAIAALESGLEAIETEMLRTGVPIAEPKDEG